MTNSNALLKIHMEIYMNIHVTYRLNAGATIKATHILKDFLHQLWAHKTS